MGCVSTKKVVNLLDSDAFFQNYTLGRKIGEGAFGQVRLAQHTATKAFFAVKIADAREDVEGNKLVISARRKSVVEREIQMWTLASASENPQITLMKACFYSSGFYYMVCELCQKNLMQHLLTVKRISEAALGEVAAQMALSISHVHSIGLIHRAAWCFPCGFLSSR